MDRVAGRAREVADRVVLHVSDVGGHRRVARRRPALHRAVGGSVDRSALHLCAEEERGKEDVET